MLGVSHVIWSIFILPSIQNLDNYFITFVNLSDNSVIISSVMMLLKKSLQKIRGRIRSVQCIESLGDLFCEGLIYTVPPCTLQVQNGYYCMPCTVLITNGKSRLCSHVTPKQCRGFLMYKTRGEHRQHAEDKHWGRLGWINLTSKSQHRMLTRPWRIVSAMQHKFTWSDL